MSHSSLIGLIHLEKREKDWGRSIKVRGEGGAANYRRLATIFLVSIIFMLLGCQEHHCLLFEDFGNLRS
jgi:hypothetical protein